MKHNTTITQISKVSIVVFIALLFIFSACNKDEEPSYTSSFSYEFLNDNTVRYTNESTGEYYSLTWDFGNGTIETTTDKKKTFDVYYPIAGDYVVSLRLTNYTGGNKTSEQTVSVTATNFVASFTAEIDVDNPNYVNLVNTTQGQYDSFKWKYRNLEVENEMEHLAYFPMAGEYEIDLVVTSNNQDYTETKSVTISQDDPDYIVGLIWSDEFDYSGLPDPAKWNMETGGGGWGNNELQYYTNRIENAEVEDGVLTITAREEDYGGRDYTSARMTTQDKFDFKYGRIEARIKLPYGQGLWPAFWMLGANIGSEGWPACGEIDIMEMVGGTNGDNTVYSTLHWDNSGEHADYGKSYSLSSGIFADDYHVFSVEWNSQEIKGFVDGTEYFAADITPGQLSEFHDNFFIIMNVAVGGNWPGPPDGSTTFPQTMKVDYVRVFQD